MLTKKKKRRKMSFIVFTISRINLVIKFVILFNCLFRTIDAIASRNIASNPVSAASSSSSSSFSSSSSSSGICRQKLVNLGANDFVFQCTEDGNFKEKQCYQKTNICFCVNPITGEPNNAKNIDDKDCKRKRARHWTAEYDQRKNRNPSTSDDDDWSVDDFDSGPHGSHHRESARASSPPPRPQPTSATRRRDAKDRANRCNKLQRVRQIKEMNKYAFAMDDDLTTSGILVESSSPARSSSPIHVYGIRRPPPQASGGGGEQTNLERTHFGIRRFSQSSSSLTSASSAQASESVIERKFTKLDLDRNRALSGDEFGSMMLALDDSSSSSSSSSKSSAQSTRPATRSGCANSLFAFCDSNHDLAIDAREFVACFDPANTLRLQKRLQAAKRGRFGAIRPPHYDRAPSLRRPSQSSSPNNHLHQHQSSQSRSPPPPRQQLETNINLANFAPDDYSALLLNNSNKKQENAAAADRIEPDCWVTQRNLLNNTESPNGASSGVHNGGSLSQTQFTFVPRCTPNGYYEEIQCAAEPIELCWCVDRTTGKTINEIKWNSTSGSTSGGAAQFASTGVLSPCAMAAAFRPQKPLSSSSSTFVSNYRASKHCPPQRRSKFHYELRRLLESRAQTCESAFRAIDLDRNDSIDAAEWKPFKRANRKSISAANRKCFRDELQFCSLHASATSSSSTSSSSSAASSGAKKRMSRDEWIRCCKNHYPHVPRSRDRSQQQQQRLSHELDHNDDANRNFGQNPSRISINKNNNNNNSNNNNNNNVASKLFDAYNRKKDKLRPTGANPFTSILRGD